MKKYRCRNCNYRFSSQIDATKKACQNCGEKNFIAPEESAEDLVSSSDN